MLRQIESMFLKSEHHMRVGISLQSLEDSNEKPPLGWRLDVETMFFVPPAYSMATN